MAARMSDVTPRRGGGDAVRIASGHAGRCTFTSPMALSKGPWEDLDFATVDVESSMLSPKLRKNPRGRRGSCLKLKSSTGGEPMGPPLEFPHGELLASVAEAEARYIARDHATDYDLPRMKLMFNRFAMDGEVQKECLPMIFSYLGFLKVSDSEVREAADEVSTYPSLDFHDFGAVYEQVVHRERELLALKLSQWLAAHEPREDVAEASLRRK